MCVHVCVPEVKKKHLHVVSRSEVLVLAYIGASSGGHVAAYVGRGVCECVYTVHYT